MTGLSFQILGDDMQVLEVELTAANYVKAEIGALMYKDVTVQMETAASGGVFGGIKRMMTGESYFVSSFRHNSSGTGKVAFTAPYPGKIIKLDLSANKSFFCQKDSFLCCESNIDISVAFTKKIGVGLFGGEGFVLQKLQGSGLAFVHGGGSVIHRHLSQGEELHVDTGCLLGFNEGVGYDVSFVGGFRNSLFGGEGVFFIKLKGPGDIFLQSLPFSRLSDRIRESIKSSN
jgi:uncharacterized protein (TIGR00266 family)